MYVSIFEIIGPVMLGPSSSGTAGMAKIGAVAHEFVEGAIRSVQILFHPRHYEGYTGCRSHLALLGGALGLSLDQADMKHSLDIAKQRGIEVKVGFFAPPLPENGLTAEVTIATREGKQCCIRGVSLGGGMIEIIGVDRFPVELVNTEGYLFAWSEKDLTEELQQMIDTKRQRVGCSCGGEELLYYINGSGQEVKDLREKVALLSGVRRTVCIKPILTYGFVPHEALFTTCEELCGLERKSGVTVPRLALEYERVRSGRSVGEIRSDMTEQLKVMRESCERGLQSVNKPLYGFTKGDTGIRLQRAVKEGKTLGGILPRAVSKALAVMDVGMSMGTVVAAPTGGSCGILPGCLLAAQEEYGFSDENLVEAMFAAAAMGVVMRYKSVVMSGMGGGCQGEIGVSSAMAASALTYLGGGSGGQICHAMALALKGLMGLICDPIGANSEIPCIKRNGSGVANAFSAADMALAGIESYIPPDEVIDALVDAQKRMPPELRCGCGGLFSTRTAAAAREEEKRLDELIRL